MVAARSQREPAQTAAGRTVPHIRSEDIENRLQLRQNGVVMVVFAGVATPGTLTTLADGRHEHEAAAGSGSAPPADRVRRTAMRTPRGRAARFARRPSRAGDALDRRSTVRCRGCVQIAKGREMVARNFSD